MSFAIAQAVLPVRKGAQETNSTPTVACFHCGQPCHLSHLIFESKSFCCSGCKAVHDILQESGLGRFYELESSAGVRRSEEVVTPSKYAFLDSPEISSRILDFTSTKLSRVTFQVPAIHCVACVWLLENLFRLAPGIGTSIVNFPKREVSIVFSPEKISLSQLVHTLASIGYEPVLTLGELDRIPTGSERKRKWLQIGIAGFAFGNVMLMSLPLYLGMDTGSGPLLRSLFGYLSLALTLPVLVYSASDYFLSAIASLKQKMLSLDVPIAIGLIALYAQSCYEIARQIGPGYLDSLCGLVFFLLCGRMFQHKIHDQIAFDLDYKSFFPLSARRIENDKETSIALCEIKVGDHLRLKHGDLIPADSILLKGDALVDYSFVSGEADPVRLGVDQKLYAGGKQIGGFVEIEITKPISQSYLVSLWNHQAFTKNSSSELNSLTNRYSRRFTFIVLFTALAAFAGWSLTGDFSRGLKAFVSVLIVACPCALALAAPFALGTAQRFLGKMRIYLRNSLVLERLAQVQTIVFDKTGTLTTATSSELEFVKDNSPLSDAEVRAITSVASASSHPRSLEISRYWITTGSSEVELFQEKTGFGVSGQCNGMLVHIGSRTWLVEAGISVSSEAPDGTCVAIDRVYRGLFRGSQRLRLDADKALRDLANTHDLVLLSGDNDRERQRFQSLLGSSSILLFNQSPVRKLEFVEKTQKDDQRVVMMIGDGLNDAGALKQSDVGIAVAEATGSFTPSSDIVMDASTVSRIPAIMELAKSSVKIVRLSFWVSAAYNVLGIGIAAAGLLSPVICAILMPVSSISVALLASGLTMRAARQLEPDPGSRCL